MVLPARSQKMCTLVGGNWYRSRMGRITWMKRVIASFFSFKSSVGLVTSIFKLVRF